MGERESFVALQRVDEVTWRIPRSYDSRMRVDGLIFADEVLMEQARADQALKQVANVATLPGIQTASLAMPDIHWGYGFPIGGVAATDPEEGGVISPGGVGYDINCGVRILRSKLTYDDVRSGLDRLMNLLHRNVPSGVGSKGPYRFAGRDLDHLLAEGVRFLKRQGWATDGDVDYCEAGGAIADADPSEVSPRAKTRGEKQCGTLGAGNHFLEIQRVEEIWDQTAADAMGIHLDQICVMIHSGSRGLGYQVCDDALKYFRNAPQKYGISLPDRQLACAPIDSPEGERYLGSMRAAANYAWANRQLLAWQVRETMSGWAGKPWESLGLGLVYDVAHNIAKLERHVVDGVEKTVCVHRKGATRAFPPGHREVPSRYRQIGQPVIIPGDMGRASWILVGQPGSMERAFGSCCHGAGRVMSRTESIRRAKGRRIDQELAEVGVIARCRSWKGLAEEQPDAYKDVGRVVEVVERAGLANRVARLRPIGVVKG